MEAVRGGGDLDHVDGGRFEVGHLCDSFTTNVGPQVMVAVNCFKNLMCSI